VVAAAAVSVEGEAAAVWAAGMAVAAVAVAAAGPDWAGMARATREAVWEEAAMEAEAAKEVRAARRVVRR